MHTVNRSDHDELAPGTAEKMTRYLIVTAIASPSNLALFAIGVVVFGLPAVAANVLAATLVSIPAYVVSRRWVWRIERGTPMTSEAIQYWCSTMLSLLLASIALWILDASGAADIWLLITPLAVYTALWIARYLFLDRYLFRRTGGTPSTVTPTGSMTG